MNGSHKGCSSPTMEQKWCELDKKVSDLERQTLMQEVKKEMKSLEVQNENEILSQCLKEEKEILASASEAQGCSSPTMEQKWCELDNKVSDLERQTSEVEKEIQSLEVENEIHVEQHVGLAQSQAVVEEECLKQANFITQTKQMLLQQIVNILKLAVEIVVALTDVELPEWKRRQQMACIGGPVDTCLDHLQKWFTTVAQVLLRVREQLQKLQDQNKKYNNTDVSNHQGPMEEIEKFTQSLFKKLLANALVVEKQPVMYTLPQRPLILTIGVYFTMTVRFLANLPEFKCLLKVKAVFDKDTEESKTIKGLRHFDLSREDCEVLNVNTPNDGLVAEFSHMFLKEIKGRARESLETHLGVTEELHIMKFVTEFRHAGLECNIEASSLPVVVISSANQISGAWASVMWYNMLSTSEPRNLSLSVDPPPLTWKQLSQVLSWQFLSVGQRELDGDQLPMLRDKFVDGPDDLIHWSKFSKPDSAWFWIDGILDLIKNHLQGLWRDGFIMGFVSRTRTRALLQEKQAGTFLLRFSESNRDGAITFSWVEHSNGEIQVQAVEPYTKQVLSVMSLPDCIYHFCLKAQRTMPRNPLLYLYPDIPRDTAFGRFYKTSAGSEHQEKYGFFMSTWFIPRSEMPPTPCMESPMTGTESFEFFSQLFGSSESLDHWINFRPTPPTQSNDIDPSSST